MHPDRAPVAQTLGLGGSHVVGPQVLGQVGPHQPGDVGHRGRGQHEGGQDQLVGGALGGGDREPAQPDPEDQLGEAPDHEDGDRDQEQRAYRDQVVDELPRRMPASTPAVMPITDSMTTAIVPSLSVTGQRAASSSTTLLPKKLVPRSPCTRLPM